jgi:hypothetical protein
MAPPSLTDDPLVFPRRVCEEVHHFDTIQAHLSRLADALMPSSHPPKTVNDVEVIVERATCAWNDWIELLSWNNKAIQKALTPSTRYAPIHWAVLGLRFAHERLIEATIFNPLYMLQHSLDNDGTSPLDMIVIASVWSTLGGQGVQAGLAPLGTPHAQSSLALVEVLDRLSADERQQLRDRDIRDDPDHQKALNHLLLLHRDWTLTQAWDSSASPATPQSLPPRF